MRAEGYECWKQKNGEEALAIAGRYNGDSDFFVPT